MLHQVASIPVVRRNLAGLATLVGALVLAPISSTTAQTVSAPLNVTTFAGSAGVRQVTDGTGTAARFYAPAGVVIDKAGNLIVADTCNNVFRKITPAGVVTVFVGSPLDSLSNPINVGSTDGTGGAAKFHIGDYQSSGGGVYGPPIYTTIGSMTLGVDSAGTVYFADTINGTIRKITSAGVVTTVAGSPGAQGSADANGTSATFNVPGGVAVDASGNIYVADSGNDTIRKITPSGDVSTLAGTARAFGSVDGTGAAARFMNPSGVAVDSSGNVYVTDTGNHVIRKITPGGVVTTLAGAAGSKGTADGNATSARFNSPTGIAVDSAGYVYVADTENHAIRKISPSGTVTTIAGTVGVSGSTDGTGTSAQFYEPYGVTVDASGTLYIADTSNDTIRHGVPATTTASLQILETPPSLYQTTAPSGNITLKVVANGSPTPTYQWSKDGTAISGETNSTLSVTNASSVNAGNYTVTVNSGSLTFTSAPTRVQVFANGTPLPSVTLIAQPADRTVTAGQSTTFTVEATSSAPLSYQWNLNGTAITGATGSTYTIASAQISGTYSVTVTDGSSSVTSANAALLVQGAQTGTAPAITTQPASQTVNAGSSVTFSVTATGTPAPTYQWQKNGTDLSNSSTVSGAATSSLTIASTTAGDAGNYTVVVTNSVSSVVSNVATLTIGSAPPPPPPGPAAWLTNVSVRTTMQVGQDPLNVGLSVTGGQKAILFRSGGPGLGTLGLTGFMTDPKLDVYVFGAHTPAASNDDWDSASIKPVADSLGAYPFVAGSKDAALIQNVTGSYTAVEDPRQGGTVLVEAYDTNPTVSSTRFNNVSARNFTGTGDSVLIAGFAVRGTGTMKLLIRGVGPTLGTLGVSGTLADPQIVVYDDTNTIIAQNDNWDSSLTSTFDAVGAFHLTSSKDSALVVTVQGGPAGKNYTVQVKGADGGTGVALIEVYEVPN